jgi:hypothetical protein
MGIQPPAGFNNWYYGFYGAGDIFVDSRMPLAHNASGMTFNLLVCVNVFSTSHPQ